tara:strand:- start:272 stop:1306 length:1035 start_codon:yes stop_codon:yes gene_type:complete
MHQNIIIYSVLSFIILLICANISYKLNLLDIPYKRKKHSKPTAYTGGLAISLAYVCSIQLLDVLGYKLNLILSIAFFMAIVGFVDDKFKLNTGGKLSLQIIPIFYLIVIENISLSQIGDYNYFNLKLNSFEIPFTVLCVLFLINAFNYFDGKDGTLSFTSISVLAILYFLTIENGLIIDKKPHGDINIELFLLSILLPICIFLFFNFSLFNLPKMFLGDSGSLLLGFVIAFTIIYFADKKIAHPILLAWSIVIFVYEFLSINLQRLRNNQNIFKAGLDHLHHAIFQKTNSIFITNFVISITNIVLFFVGYISFKIINPLASLILFIFFFIIFFIFRNFYSSSKK